MFQEIITNEEVNLLPLISFEGEIVVIDDENQKEAADYLLSQKVIGFDTESRVSFKKGSKNEISLLQLSSADRAYLIRLNNTKLSKDMIKVLQSRSVKKIGAAIADDIKLLQGVSPFYSHGFIDLQTMVKEYGIKDISLKKMTAIVLGSRISKAQRLSNWVAVSLTELQQRYAATDAWICREIYKQLMKSEKIVVNGKSEIISKEG